MKVAPMGEVRNSFAKYLAEEEEGPVFVTRNGGRLLLNQRSTGKLPFETRAAAQGRCHRATQVEIPVAFTYYSDDEGKDHGAFVCFASNPPGR